MGGPELNTTQIEIHSSDKKLQPDNKSSFPDDKKEEGSHVADKPTLPNKVKVRIKYYQNTYE
ncbi:hypothetical protein [Legionella cincinnatiensis]|uniref:Uncharacterized protein n=1 Tax=Legionella cincinnatiensis TaxID=28085 RepID=A0A378IK60_9GAMM|nr:hypothetical protein [Legionella cincinnatiensis]KTC82122.1 hypothetical protein Lcin_3192 [Legionella cincinnatiensis]STX35403.1 Uncharacterised protein [Legionella cincinnatiensis]